MKQAALGFDSKITMTKAIVCKYCKVEIPLEVSDLTDHIFNHCSRKLVTQCRNPFCLQLFSTREEFYKHASEVHPDEIHCENVVLISNDGADDASITPIDVAAACDVKSCQAEEESNFPRWQTNYGDGVQVEQQTNEFESPEDFEENFINAVTQFLKSGYGETCRLEEQIQLYESPKESQCAKLRAVRQISRKSKNTSTIQQNHEPELASLNIPQVVHDSVLDAENTSQNKKKPFGCHCNATFSHKKFLLLHLSRTHGTKRVKCPYEGCESYVKPHCLTKHIRHIHQRVKQQCINCEKWFAKNKFYMHRKMCPQNPPETSKTILKNVKSPSKTKKPRKPCNTCGKLYSPSQLWHHQKICSSEVEKEFLCGFEGCTAAFTTKHYLTTHVKKTHGSPVVCLFCDRHYPPHSLMKHVKFNHKMRKCYKCQKWITLKSFCQHEC